MIDPGRGGFGHAGCRRAEVEVSVASDGVCAEEFVHDGDLPGARHPLARLHPEVSQ